MSTGSCSSATTKALSPRPGAWAGSSPKRCSAEDFDSALSLAGRLQDIFGKENLFVELQDHGIGGAEDRPIPASFEIARALDAPLLATNDSHYCRREDAVAHDALLCVQTGATIHDPKRFKFEGEEHYLKSAREMRRLFAEVPAACDNTLWVRRAGQRRARARQAGAAPVPCAGSLPEARPTRSQPPATSPI